ncbi:hypothetical protein ABID21_001008 [Pseudorhizobium tarimense]|uniref:Uncharacterized protein n=1 Tax=Pseudorhizobium tarimense TaxID=1079109 RepID=A0ABV2H2Y7_9HYPH
MARFARSGKSASAIDGYQDRAALLYCMLPPGDDHTSGDVFELATGPEFATGLVLQSEVKMPLTKARYVTIISPLPNALHLSDLKSSPAREASCPISPARPEN